MTFGPTVGGFIGNMDHFLLLGGMCLHTFAFVWAVRVIDPIAAVSCSRLLRMQSARPDYPGCVLCTVSNDVRRYVFAMRSVVLCQLRSHLPVSCVVAITPLLMTGSFAERMKWKHSFFFIILWEMYVLMLPVISLRHLLTICVGLGRDDSTVYYPVAHWIWGAGFLGNWGTLDFAGGIVIHTTAGVGSIVCALMLGRREQFERYMVCYTRVWFARYRAESLSADRSCFLLVLHR